MCASADLISAAPWHGRQSSNAFICRVVAGDAGLGLHRIAGDPLRAEVDPHDMRGLGKSFFGAPPIAVFIVERQVVGQFVVQADGAVRDGLAGLDHDRQVLVCDLDELGRVLRQGLGLRDHQSHGFADETGRGRAPARRETGRAASCRRPL